MKGTSNKYMNVTVHLNDLYRNMTYWIGITEGFQP